MVLLGASTHASAGSSSTPTGSTNIPAGSTNTPAASPNSPPAASSAAAIDSSGSLLLAPLPAGAKVCLPSGDGYLRARLAGAIETTVDWPNSGTHCEGESRDNPARVRLSFRRVHSGKPDLLFVFGITGVREGKPAHEAGTNLTVIVQGTGHIYGTLGDSRCTVDSLTQRRLDALGNYRIEARGFCTQPAHAVRGEDAVLVSTFEFAGPVNYAPPKN
jgi:hypothetical protein